MFFVIKIWPIINVNLTGGGGGPKPKILFYAITRSKNIDPSRINHIFKIAKYIHYLAAARFTRHYLKILNFDTRNLSPTVFELET